MTPDQFCPACKREVIGDIVAHELRYHDGAQIGGLTNLARRVRLGDQAALEACRATHVAALPDDEETTRA